MKKSIFLLSILVVMMFTVEVCAETPKFGIGARAGYNFYRDGSMDVAGINVDYSNNGAWAFGFIGILKINKYISTELAIDFINSSKNEFTFAGASWKAGEIKQMPLTLTAQFHYPVGIVSPYIGLGLGYYIRSYDKDNTFFIPAADVSVDNGWGYHVNAGSDIFITQARNLALNIDFKYVWAKTDITAAAGAVKLERSMNLDSFLVNFGIKYFF
ncbi:MAG: hypothetical protein GX874_14145 [Smithella sp.]|nr:hypothetical protein [Smithella sp.]